MASRGIHRIFVGNIPWTVGHQELRIYFQEFGKITSSKVIFDKKTGCSKGFGFITADKTVCDNLKKVDQHILEGNVLNVQTN